MKQYTILYNPLAHKGKGLEDAKKIEEVVKDAAFTYVDATTIRSLRDFLEELPADIIPVVTGGDGSLNHVINELDGYDLKCDLYYFPAGSGNDFINDLHKPMNCMPFPLNPYMEHLPTVTVKGKRYKFLNAIGLGLDGYCCEESDRLKALGKEKAYTVIAAEGLAYKFKPVNAKVTVDGETLEFHRVWMAPTMFGSYYGGGVCMGPEQHRDNPEHLVSGLCLHGVGRFIGALMFLDVCKGKGGKYPKNINMRKGRHVEVEIDRPVALQIDGETILNVTSYFVDAAED